MYDYHRLVVWQKAHVLSLAVIAGMPRKSRRYATLVSQIMRAAESIPTTIVEGRAADSDAEFARVLNVSLKSSNELLYQLETGVGRGMLEPKVFDELRIKIIEVQVLLQALIRKLEDDDRSGPDRVRE